MNEIFNYVPKEDLIRELREIHHRYALLNLESDDEDSRVISHLSTLNLLIQILEEKKPGA